MKKGILTLTLLATFSTASFSATIVVPGGSTVLDSWSFENFTAPAAGTTLAAGAADIGSLTAGSSASSLHASSSTPTAGTGNGSSKSFSSNTWAVGDSYQFVLSTTGFSNIYVTFGQAGSNTGPRDFKIAYSTDGTNFTDTGSTYSVPASSFSTSSFQSGAIFSFNLSAITALNGVSSLTLRLLDNSTTSVNAGTVAAAGTNRVDDFTVSSGPVTLVSSVPEPSTFATLLGGFGMLMGFRRLRGSYVMARRTFTPLHPGVGR